MSNKEILEDFRDFIEKRGEKVIFAQANNAPLDPVNRIRQVFGVALTKTDSGTYKVWANIGGHWSVDREQDFFALLEKNKSFCMVSPEGDSIDLIKGFELSYKNVQDYKKRHNVSSIRLQNIIPCAFLMSEF